MTDANNTTNEAALLASLGSTTADASTYESSILRNAKLRSAPQIELPHAEIARAIAANTSSNAAINGGGGGLVPCGAFGINLPDLAGMAPSTCADGNRRINNNNNNSAEDVPHLLTVLSKVRQSLHSAQSNKSNGSSNIEEEDEETRKRNMDLLHMKEQLCLAYLHNVAGITDDDGIIPADHYRSNNKRRRRISANGGKMDAADEYYGVLQDDDNGDDYSSLSDAKKPAAAKRSGKASSSSQSSQPLLSSHHVSRLDQIKKGHQFNHPNNNDNDNTTSTTKPLRKRNTIMSLKSQMRIDNGLTPLKSMEEERYDAEQSRKRREERKRRRLKRRRELLGLSSVDESSEEEVEFVDESEKKVEDGMRVAVKDAGILKDKLKEGDEVMSTKKRGVRWAEEEQKDSKDSNAATPTTKRSTTKVYCPICETILIFNNDKAGEGEDTPDAFLSRHIAECQQSSGGRSRKTRTSRRKKKRVVD